MLSRHVYRGLIWIDLESPTPAEVRSLMDEFDLHPLAAEELLKPSLKSKVERHDDTIYLILHFPTAAGQLSAKLQEVDFILGKDFIITTRYEAVDPLFKFSRVFEAHALIDRSGQPTTPSYLFIAMVRNIYASLESELDAIALGLLHIEERIFKGQERQMVTELSRAARVLLTFRQALAPHKVMLESLEGSGVQLYGQGFLYHLKSIIGEYSRVAASLDGERAMLDELRKTNDSLLSTKQNETMQRLTILTFVSLPLTVLAALFGMNAEHTPIVGHLFDFWIILGLMACLTVLLFSVFKLKRWL